MNIIPVQPFKATASVAQNLMQPEWSDDTHVEVVGIAFDESVAGSEPFYLVHVIEETTRYPAFAFAANTRKAA